jgi:hypothetical protein
VGEDRVVLERRLCEAVSQEYDFRGEGKRTKASLRCVEPNLILKAGGTLPRKTAADAGWRGRRDAW